MLKFYYCPIIGLQFYFDETLTNHQVSKYHK